MCDSGLGTKPPTSPEALLAPLSHGRSTNTILLTPGGHTLLGSVSSRQNPRQTEYMALGQGPFCPHTPDQSRALPLHVQILVSLDLINSADLTLTIP